MRDAFSSLLRWPWTRARHKAAQKTNKHIYDEGLAAIACMQA